MKIHLNSKDYCSTTEIPFQNNIQVSKKEINTQVKESSSITYTEKEFNIWLKEENKAL